MPNPTNTQIDAALERGRTARRNEPRATTAHYNRPADRIIVELNNGCTFTFPPNLAQGLQTATPDQLAEIEILGAGTGLHWEALDTDLSIPALLASLFGTATYRAQQAGRTKSLAKAAAAKTNGAKGGRPRKAPASVAQ